MTEAFEQNLINLGDIHSTGVYNDRECLIDHLQYMYLLSALFE